MAKEYEMLFKLNAQMGSAYQQTFKAAQSSIKNFNTEYRTLSSTASDITGYQRQQSACESTKAKLDMLKQQYDNIQREMDETGNSSSDLQNKLLAKKAQIDKTTAAYQQQMEKLEAYRQRLEGAGVDTDNLKDEEKRLREELERLRHELEQGGEEEEKFGDKGKEAMSELGAAIAAAGIVQGLKKIGQAFADCIDVTAEFEAGVSQIAATMGVTTDEITDLSAFAKEMGAATSFSAVESADALNVLAMAGLNAEQQIEALPTVLDLAAAGAMEIATAAGYVTGAVKGFSDEMSNSGYYADLMAKGATMANTNVDQLGAALSAASATASSYGQEAESVTVALLRLAEQNVTGTEAATKLNRAMADLYTPTEEAAAVLDGLGVATYDEQGNARDLNTVMDDLKVALQGYSAEQQNSYKATIFTTNGLNAFNKMTVSSTETVERFWDGLANAGGSASEQAATQLDNFKGSTVILNSAIEGTRIALGELYTGALQKITNVATNIFSGITKFIQQNPILVKAIVALTVGVAAFVVGLTVYITVSKVAKAATDALHASMKDNPYLLVGTLIAGVVVALGTFIASTSLAEDSTKRLSAVSQQQADHIDDLKLKYAEVSSTMGETSAEAQLLKKQIDDETASFEANKQTVAELQEELQATHDAYVEMESGYRKSIDSINGEFSSTSKLIDELNSLTSAEEQTAASKEKILAIVDILNERIPELGLNYDVLTGALNMTPEDIQSAAAKEAETDTRQKNYEQLKAALAQREDLTKKLDLAYDQYAAAQDKAYELEKTDYHGSAYGIELSSAAYKAAVEEFRTAETQHEEALADWQANETEIAELSEKLAGSTEDASDGIGEMDVATSRLNESMEALTKSYNDAYDAALNSISGQNKLWDDAAEVSATSVDSVIAAQESQTQYWTDYKTNIDTLLGYSGQIEGLSEMVATFGDGSADSVNMVAGMAEAAASGDPTKLQELVDAWMANKAAQDEAAGSLADLTTGYSDAMAQIGEEFANQVPAWDLSKEAGDAGMNTVQGYIDAAKDMLPAVYAAYQSVGQTAMNAIRSASWYGNSTGDGYAIGTESATPGFHLVGENGPELMFFNGGEQVLTAEETAALMNNRPDPVGISLGGGGENVTITFAPQYTISGDQNADEIREILIAHDAELIEQLREVIKEEKEDAQRRAYV